LWDDFDAEELKDVEVETCRGEYYLDSMALLPEYRGMELAKRLLLDGIERGKAAGCGRVTLIVSVDKPQLQEYYASMGFEAYGTMDFFGHRYNRMRYMCK
jgi:ribosomal protein S18 acetylase RimI-like enzyme